jgi:hypothetical protein
LLFGRKNKPQVDLGDLHGEKANLTSFLQSKLKFTITENQNRLLLDSDTLPSVELQRIVTKFLYHKNLNNTHYASLDGNLVRINTFKGVNKKTKKTKKDTLHQTATQSWGL